MFAPARPVAPLRALLLGFSPYAFAGVGGYGARPVNAPDTTHATWSVGAGAHHELLAWLGIGGEARYRQLFNSDSAAFGQSWRDKLEYRVGLTVSFGGRHRAVPGDSTPRDGFDAAGFVRYVFGQQGVSLPSTVREIASTGSEVPTRVGALRPGDLLFFANDGTSVNHVAIYAGRDRIIHSTATGNGVRYDTLGEDERGRWFTDHLVSARRIAAAGSGPSPRDDAGDRAAEARADDHGGRRATAGPLGTRPQNDARTPSESVLPGTIVTSSGSPRW